MKDVTDSPISVAIAESKADELARTRVLLLQDRRLRVVGTASERGHVLALAELEPDILLLSCGLDPEGLPALVQELVAVAPTCQVILLVGEGETVDVGQAMASGARGILRRPLTSEEVVRTIYRVHEVELTRRRRLGEIAQAVPGAPKRGKVMVVFSPKGGVGCTLLATNLAIALRSVTGKSVALVDYSLQFGSVGSMLNLQSFHTVAELAPRHGEIDSTVMDDVLVRHSSGVRVLLPPANPEEMEHITTEGLVNVLEELRKQFDYVVVDTWHVVEPSTIAVLELADQLLLVITPEVPALSAARHFLNILKSYPQLRDKPRLVVNRHPSTGQVDLQYIENGLGLRAFATVPSDGQMLTLAINEAQPMFTKHANRLFIRNVSKMASQLAGTSENGATSPPASGARRFALSRRNNT
jgi:pilus assembly protein CpaE